MFLISSKADAPRYCMQWWVDSIQITTAVGQEGHTFKISCSTAISSQCIMQCMACTTKLQCTSLQLMSVTCLVQVHWPLYAWARHDNYAKHTETRIQTRTITCKICEQYACMPAQEHGSDTAIGLSLQQMHKTELNGESLPLATHARNGKAHCKQYTILNIMLFTWTDSWQ